MTIEGMIEQQPDTVAPPRFVSEVGRSQIVDLAWPIEYGGRIWSQITVRRLTAREVDAAVEASRAGLDDTLPIFDAPAVVLDALDADDSERLNEVAKNFFPRALKASS